MSFFLIPLLLLLSNMVESQALSGLYNIPGSYPTLTAAINDLNLKGISSTVTFNVASGYSEVAPAGGFRITATGTPANQIIFQKSGTGANPEFTASSSHTLGSINDAIFKIVGGDYITLDGFTLKERNIVGGIVSADTAIATNTLTEWGIALLRASNTNGAQSNTIQNCKISLELIYKNGFGIYSNAQHTEASPTGNSNVTAATGANSFNKVYTNEIRFVNIGIGFFGANANTFRDEANDIGGNTSAKGNLLTNWGGAKTASAYQNVPKTSFGIAMFNQNNGNLSYNQITTDASVATGTTTLQGIIYDNSSASATSTTENITFNTITLTNASSALTQGIVFSSPGSAITTNITNNSILNCSIAGAFTGIANTGTVSTLNILANTISGTIRTGASGNVIGISNSAAVVTAINIKNNRLGNPNISGNAGRFITYQAASTGTLFGITNTNGASTATLTIDRNDISGIVDDITSATAHTYIRNTTPIPTQVISHNTFTNLNINSSGAITFIVDDENLGASGSMTIDSNAVVTGFTKIASASAVTFYATNGGATSFPHNLTISNNKLSNISLSGSEDFVGINALRTNTIKTITGNVFEGITGGTGTLTLISLNSSGANSAITNNVLKNIVWGAATNALTIGAANTNPFSVYGNRIDSIFLTTGSLVGILNNGTSADIYNNNIYNLQTNGTTPTTNTSGISIAASSNTTIYNNFISDLRAPTSNYSLAVTGINLAGGTNINLFYNTIKFGTNAAPITSSATNFGVSGIYWSATVSNLTSQNNIININATHKGTGSIAAFRRSTTGTTGTPPSGLIANNNIYWVNSGTGAGSSQRHFLYVEGSATAYTNGFALDGLTVSADRINDPAFNIACGAYKTFMAGNESLTFSEDNLVAGTIAGTFAPTATSYAENSAAMTSPTINTDFAGTTRTNDRGALVFSGTEAPIIPEITTQPATNTDVCGGTSFSLSVVAASPTALSYQWKLGGSPVGTNSATYTVLSATALDAGTYTVDVITSCGTTTTSNNAVVNVTLPLTATISYNGSPFCKNITSAMPTFTGTGTNGVYSSTAGLTINPTTGEINPSTSTAGNYVVTYTTAATGICPIITTTTNVTINPLPSINTASITLCESSFGSASATFDLTSVENTITGGANGMSVLWYDDVNLTNAIATSYTSSSTTVYAKVTNTTTSCTNSINVALIVNPLPIANTASINLCESSSGSASATFDLTSVESTVTGGISGRTVAWYDDINLTGSIGTPASYTTISKTVYAKVTNTTTNCTNSVAVILTVNPLPILTASSPTVCSGSTLSLTPATGGTWLSNNTSNATVTNAGLVTGTLTGGVAGNVTFTFTETATNCSATTSAITVNPLPNATIGAPSPANTCQNGTISMILNGSSTNTAGRPFTFAYNINGTPQATINSINTGTTAPIPVTTTTAGTFVYTLTSVSNNYGCIRNITTPAGNQSRTIVINPLPSLTTNSQINVSCNGGNDGTVTVVATGASSPYTYTWNTSPIQTNAMATNLPQGSYTVTVTDVNTCVSSTNVNITQPAILSASLNATNVTCNGANDGTISITASAGGYGTYEYSINGGSTWQSSGAYSNVANGTYNVQMRDAAHTACIVTLNGTLMITQPTVLSANINATNVTCNGANDGSISITSPAGGYGTYQYSINGGGTWQNTGSYTGLANSTYNVQIRDAATLCTITLNGALNITQPAALSANVTPTNVTCNGANDGTISITTPTGGYGTYEYSIDGGATWSSTGTFTGLANGTYNVQIRDAAHTACVMVLDTALDITEPAPLSANLAFANVTCNGANNGTISITLPTGGYGTYQYSIDGGTNWQSSGTFTGLSNAVYDVKIRDSAYTNCAISLNGAVQITQPAVLSANVNSTNVTCNGADDATISISSPAGGYGTYQYSIDAGTNWQASGTFTGLANGTYNVQIRDAAYTTCIIILDSTLAISEPTVLSASITSTNVTCNGANDGTISITAPNGGYGTYQYSIDGGTTWQSSGIFTALANATYNIQIRDSLYSTCVITLNGALIISQPTILSASITSSNVTCNGANDGTINIIFPAGGYGTYEYSIDGGSTWQSSGTFTGLANATYKIQIRDAIYTTCIVTLDNAFVITQPTLLAANISSQINANCFGASTGSATVTASNGTPNYTYTWNTIPAQYTATAINLAAGNYTVTVRDSNLCSKVDSVTITQAPLLTASVSGNTSSACYNTDATFTITGALNATVSYTLNGVPANTVLTGGSATVTATAITSSQTLILTAITDGTCAENLNSSATITVTSLAPAPTLAFSSPASANSNLTVCVSTPVNISSPTANVYEYLWYKNGTPINYTLAPNNVLFTPTNIAGTDVYSLVVTYVGGQCLSVPSAPLTLTSTTPNAIISPAGAVTTCVSSPITLSASTGANYSYVWRRGNIIVQVGASAYIPTLTGNHYVMVTDGNTGCSKRSDWVNVTLNALPIANAGLDKSVCAGQSVQIGITGTTGNTYTWTPSTGLSNAHIANPIASPSITTTYTVTVNNTVTGCSNNDAMVLTHLQVPPTPSLTTSATSVCQGSTITITPTSSNIASIYWYRNGIFLFNKPTNFIYSTATPSATNDIYVIKGIGANGCSSSFSNAVNAWVKEAATPTISSSPAAIGTTITLCVPGGTSGNATLIANSTTASPAYSWKLAGAYIAGANSNTYIANVTTTNNNKVFSVEATYPNGCVKTSTTRTVKLLTSGCTTKTSPIKNDTDDLTEITWESDLLTAYPNPTNGFLNVSIENCHSQEATIILYNTLGQIVIEKAITITNEKATEILDLREMAKGIYTLSLKTNDAQKTQKVMKE